MLNRIADGDHAQIIMLANLLHVVLARDTLISQHENQDHRRLRLAIEKLPHEGFVVHRVDRVNTVVHCVFHKHNIRLMRKHILLAPC